MEMGIEYIVRLIESKRAALDVSKNKLLRGICSTDTFTKIANGQGRKLDKLEIEALMQRIGYNAKNCNYLLDMDEYEAFVRRERIREGIKACIKGTGNLDDVKKRIEINKKDSRSNVERQAAEYFDIQLMCVSGQDNKVLYEKCINAIRITIKDFRIENIKSYLYGEIEFLLITRLLCIEADMGEKETALAGYEGLLSIIDKNIYSNNEAMKFFSKTIYEALVIYMEEGQYGKASKLCQYAIGRLPDENKFRYLPEIYEMKARAEAHLLAAEKCYSDEVLNALYKESKDYKIYEDLSYIAAGYPAEYYADVKFPMYFEYNVVFIGDIIRQRRKLLGFTQHELAYYANSDVKAGTDEICSEKTLSRLENGRMVTSWKITRRLLGRLKLPPERYFFNYVADDYNLIEELMDIEADFSSGKKDGLLERCEAVRKANPLHYYPYNQQRIAEIEYKIKYMSGMITDAEAEGMIVEIFEKTMPRSYLTDDTSVYLFGNECLVLGNILQNRKRIEGESKCLKLLEKMIDGYRVSCVNDSVCALNIISLKRKYESYIANIGDLERAKILSDSVVRDAVAHNLYGVIMPCLYDDAWNSAMHGVRDEKLRRELKCVYTASTLRKKKLLRRISKELYENCFGEEITYGRRG